MAGPQTVWGLDVGKCALKALKLRIGPDKSVEVLAADYIEHSKIMSQQGADAEELWSKAIEKFLSRNDISNDKVAVSVPGQLTLARFSKLPPVDKKKIPDIVKYEADQQIPFDMDEVVWDYQVFQAPDSPDVEVGIFAIKRELIRDHLLRFEAGSIEALLAQSAPLALYNGMQYDGALEGGAVVLVDIGTENTDLLVSTEEGLWTRTINVGGNNFTEALVKSFKLSFNKAEALKRTAATSKYARQIFQAMRPVFADLVQELQRSIGFYTATHRDAELKKVVGLGSAFKLPGLQKYIQQNLQMDFERLETFKKIHLPSTKDGGAEQAASFSVAYGLAVQGLGLAKVTSTLLPPEIVRQVVWRKKRPFFAAAAAALLLAAGVIWFRGMSDRNTLEANAGQATVTVPYEKAWQTITQPPGNVAPREYGMRIKAAADALKRKYADLSSQGENKKNEVKTVRTLLEDRAVWLKILDAILGSVPQPAGPLAKATNAKAYVEAVKAAGIPRAQRTEVFIETFEPTYHANLDEVAIEEGWAANSVEPVKNKSGQPRRGFIVAMRCRTPNKGKGLFLNETLVRNLIERGRRPGRGFYINRIGVVTAGESTRAGGRPSGSRTRTDSSRRGRRGGRGRGGGDAQPPPDQQVDTSVDPLTGESIAQDSTFIVTLDVILQDFPEKKEEQPKP